MYRLKEPTFSVAISGEFIAESVSSVFSDELNPFEDDCEEKATVTRWLTERGTGLLQRGNRKPRPRYDEYIRCGEDFVQYTATAAQLHFKCSYSRLKLGTQNTFAM